MALGFELNGSRLAVEIWRQSKCSPASVVTGEGDEAASDEFEAEILALDQEVRKQQPTEAGRMKDVRGEICMFFASSKDSRCRTSKQSSLIGTEG